MRERNELQALDEDYRTFRSKGVRCALHKEQEQCRAILKINGDEVYLVSSTIIALDVQDK